MEFDNDEDLFLIFSGPDQDPASNIDEALIPQLLLNQEQYGDTVVGDNEIINIPQESYAPLDLPPGLRFLPTDEELITHYVTKKINNEKIRYDVIPSTNVYMYNPQVLTAAYPSLGKHEWYFFTTRERKYLNGNRPNRAAGDGHWKATGADKKIYDDNNVCIGFKKSLAFFEGKATKGNKTNWLMQEYMVEQPSKQHKGTNNNMLLDCVLCRIYMNPFRSSKSETLAATEAQNTENENQTAHKRSKTEHQHNLPAGPQHVPWQHDPAWLLQPNLLMQQQNLPAFI